MRVIFKDGAKQTRALESRKAGDWFGLESFQKIHALYVRHRNQIQLPLRCPREEGTFLVEVNDFLCSQFIGSFECGHSFSLFDIVGVTRPGRK